MEKPDIIAIAALGKQTKNICHEDELLWTIKQDLQRLKKITVGHPIIMGRKTYDSIGKPLPNRTNIVLTKNYDFATTPEVKIAHSAEEALSIAEAAEGGSSKIIIFGGAEIYKLFLPMTTHLKLTLVDSDKAGTAQFPDYENDFVLESEDGGGIYDDKGVPTPYKWINYIRKNL